MNPYDELPYLGGSFRHTHPDHLGTIARLFGQRPAPASHCRVLELGCASGVNLRQMACVAPESEFVGVDGSSVQIEQGREVAAAIGLDNLRLVHRDILDTADDLGRFDYIICHGVWSWVPPKVQEAIFASCKRLLQPDGVAYISYNTLPGWYQRLQIRDLMLFHATTFEGTKDQIDQARAIMGFLSRGSSFGESVYRTMNQHWNDHMQNYWNEYVFHEYLAEVNQPVYFKDFIAGAMPHGLQYLGEAEFATMLPDDLPAEVQDDLARVTTDLLRGEQYMDFLRNRTFRRTLLVHEDVELERTLSWRSLQELRLNALFQAKDIRELGDDSDATFHRIQDEAPLSINVPIVKAALVELADRAPRSISFDDLLAGAQERLGRVEEADLESLGTNLLACASRDFLEISSQARAFTLDLSERPRASRVTLHDVQTSVYATNLLFQQVALQPFERHLLMLCDGQHDRAAMGKKLTVQMDEGLFDLDWVGPPLAGNPDVEQIMVSLVEPRLKKLAQQAMFIS